MGALQPFHPGEGEGVDVQWAGGMGHSEAACPETLPHLTRHTVGSRVSLPFKKGMAARDVCLGLCLCLSHQMGRSGVAQEPFVWGPVKPFLHV